MEKQMPMAPPPAQYPMQPQPVAPMTVAPGGNRNVKNLQYNANGQREWSHGFCDCVNECGTCLFACFCPCMVYAKVKHRVEYLNQHGRPDPTNGGSGVDGDCMLHCCLTSFFGAGWVLQIFNRGIVRGRYNVGGSGFGDCCAACWCTPCELTQESREVELEERSFTA